MTVLNVISEAALARLKTPPAFLATATPVDLGQGFHGAEEDDGGTFHWMAERGRLTFAPDTAGRYLEVWVLSEFRDLSQDLTFTYGPRVETVKLVGGWAPLSLEVPADALAADLTVNKIFPRAYYPTDSRTLGIRVRPSRLHRDRARHEHICRQHLNAVRNLSELLEGRAVLTSTPPSLGIDMYGVCNVKPPCVYCEWDMNKELEGDNVDAPFTRETLNEWGPFFDNSVSLVNCSIGEPFMMKNFDELLDIFGDGGKVLEMTTNGQILTERNIQKLLGRNVDLYISLDAATPGTYARLRNDTFDKILENLRRLIEAKGGPGGLPRIHLVFMPMQANFHELDDFVRLCAELRVDRVVLRPLNYSDSIDLDWTREGYRFQYKDQLLPFDTLVKISGRAKEVCRQLGVTLADQMDFGGQMDELFAEGYQEGRREVDTSVAGDGGSTAASASAAVAPGPGAGASTAAVTEPPPAPAEVKPALAYGAAPSLGDENRPACLEPWKSLYILRRGVFPCCYGGTPIAPMDGYRDAWNSPEMQDIRTELLNGRFHDYCLRSPACPIVRKSQASHNLPAGQAIQLRARQLWLRLDRASGNRLRHSTKPLRWLGIRLLRAVTEPRYVVHQIKRLARFVLRLPARR